MVNLSRYLRVYTSPEWQILDRSDEFDAVVSLYQNSARMVVLKVFTVTGFKYFREYDEVYRFDVDGVLKGDVQ